MQTDNIEQIEQINQINQEVQPDIKKQIFELFQLFLSNNDKFSELISKAKINLNDNEIEKIKNILQYLNTETNSKKPINDIVNELLNVFSSNSVELYEIPELINIIYELLIKLNINDIGLNELGILIKLILFVLIETNSIKLSSNNYDLIIKLIDISITLLNKTFENKLPKMKNCFCIKK